MIYRVSKSDLKLLHTIVEFVFSWNGDMVFLWYFWHGSKEIKYFWKFSVINMKHELSLLIPLLCFCIGVTVHVLLEESYTTLLPSSHLLSVSSQHSYTRDELTASRQDSWGLPGVPRGKDGAGREKMKINFIWNLQQSLSTPAFSGNASPPHTERLSRGDEGSAIEGARGEISADASKCVSQRRRGKSGQSLFSLCGSHGGSASESGLNCLGSIRGGSEVDKCAHVLHGCVLMRYYEIYFHTLLV